jgi:hypothetical protein
MRHLPLPQPRRRPRPRAATAITAISVTITTPPIDYPAATLRPHRKLASPRPPRRHTRRQRVTALMATEPRDWSGRELAERLQIPPRNLHTQLGEWAKLGFITRTGLRHLRPQHAARPRILDSQAGPLTTRLCRLRR